MALIPGAENLSQQAGMFGQVLLIGLVAVAVFAIGLLLMLIISKAAQYRYTVHIWGAGANSNLLQREKARIVKEKKTKRPMGLQFRKSKIVEEYPGLGYVSFDEKGKPFLNAILYENKLVFIKTEAFYPEKGKLSIEYMQSDLTDLVKINEEIDTEFSLNNFWDKYGGLIASGMLTIVILIFMIVVIQKFDAFNENLGVTLNGLVDRVEAVSPGGAPPS